MPNAYAMNHYAEAKEALQKIFRQLERINPSAARSLEEGLEETLTVHRLGLGAVLRRKLATTNPIESCLSTVQRVARITKRHTFLPRSSRANYPGDHEQTHETSITRFPLESRTAAEIVAACTSIPIYLASFMRALLVVGVDANDQNLLQTGALYRVRQPRSPKVLPRL